MHAFLMNQKNFIQFKLRKDFFSQLVTARLSQLFTKNLINILMETWQRQQPPEMKKIIFL